MTREPYNPEALLAGLQSPAAYPHPVDSIRVAETHISRVLLTGEFAYKLKKPVKLGFLDFTTLDLRRTYCEEELRLNRRYSPDLYLEVVPITGTPEEPRVGGAGVPIEFAVKLRQFPDDALFSQQLRKNRVTSAHIDDLARTIAEFHAGAAVAAPDSPWGTPAAVYAPVAENFEQLRLIGVGSSQVQQLCDWSRRQFDRLTPVFELRRANGFVRECHGDLHANNLLILDGRIRLFDCVEFNQNFRWVDVLSDLAFLAMDLADFGRTDFANRLLNAYLEITGDYAGLAAWNYYLVYRALVRAKVAAIRGSQQSQADRESDPHADLAKYLALAETATRADSPKLIITHGPSGSGKSTLTQPLLESLGAVRIRSDIERGRSPGFSRSDRYSPQGRQRVYDRLETLAESILNSGLTAIVDATFLKREQRTQFRELARRLNVPIVALQFQTPPEVLRERILQRQRTGGGPSEADVDVLETQLRSTDCIDNSEGLHVISIDATRDDHLPDIVRRLQSTY